MKAIVVGLGIQGNKRAAIAGGELVAAVDPVNPKARFKSIKDVPLDQFDCALVCTPDQAKFELLSYLLENGKHVLVEKPLLTHDNAQILALEELARKNRAVCYTAYNHRFEPHIMRVKQAIDSGALGKVYFAKVFYGNGTARDVKLSAWRDQGAGVLPDLGSHLLDMVLYLFGKPSSKFEPFSFNRFENLSYDHVLFGCAATPEAFPMVELEATLLSWRNTFRLDVFAEKGSAHIECLCKWGPSTFTLRKRVLPSGKPDQEHVTLECADPTWALEYEYFKKLCESGGTNLENDLWINTVLNELSGGLQ
ncbi:MAG: Gfo/Idh/MocA family oxidoreductase [Bdellovibrionota bacterium]